MPGLVPSIHGTPAERQPLLNSRVFPHPVRRNTTADDSTAGANRHIFLLAYPMPTNGIPSTAMDDHLSGIRTQLRSNWSSRCSSVSNRGWRQFLPMSLRLASQSACKPRSRLGPAVRSRGHRSNARAVSRSESKRHQILPVLHRVSLICRSYVLARTAGPVPSCRLP
jgi:hypothetical protein